MMEIERGLFDNELKPVDARGDGDSWWYRDEDIRRVAGECVALGKTPMSAERLRELLVRRRDREHKLLIDGCQLDVLIADIVAIFERGPCGARGHANGCDCHTGDR